MTPAEYTCAAPPRLVEWLQREGFLVELLVTRAETATIDPEMILPELDEVFSDEDQKNIAGLLGAYDIAKPWDPDLPSP